MVLTASRWGASSRELRSSLPSEAALPYSLFPSFHAGTYHLQALDPEAWEADHAANPPPAKKGKKSKSKKSKKADEEEEEEGGDDEDELDEAEAEAEEDEDEKPTKKRKRASSPAPKSKAKAKAPAAKSKKGGKAKKSKAAVESEDEGGEDGDAEGGEEAPVSKKHKGGDNASSLESDPEALKVREWRHKLQKTFLSSNKALPKEEEMPAVDALFTLVESYQNMNIDYLTFSKIGKVMRHIHLLEPHKVPRDDEFKFRDRAKALVDKWHQILNANKVPEGGDAAAAAAPADGEAEEAAADVNGEGDLTVMDVTMDES